ncbi:hypothetical protein BH09MYX1_BH09MYX1_24010 [soil metagenome]
MTKKRAAKARAASPKKKVVAKTRPIAKKSAAKKRVAKKSPPQKRPVAKKSAPKKRPVAKKSAPKKRPVAKKSVAKKTPKAEPRFWFVRANSRPEHVTTLCDQLFALGARGLEERDDTTLEKGATGKITVVASFLDEAAARNAKRSLSALFSPKVELMVGDRWRDEWKKHFKPFELCYGIWIRPPWEKVGAREADGAKVLELEPGRAFGTGLHETTALVAPALSSRRKDLSGKSVLDVGTGSGILALVALGLGAKDAIGIDVDADAIEVAKDNARRNSYADCTRFDITAIDSLDGAFPIVLANIEADALVAMTPELVRHVGPGGLLVLSGILQSRKDDVRRAFDPALHLLEAPSKGEWVALVYRG